MTCKHWPLVNITKPFPLHAFCPLQALVAVWQLLNPLQAFAVRHLTIGQLQLFAKATEGAAENIVAALIARAAPVSLILFI